MRADSGRRTRRAREGRQPALHTLPQALSRALTCALTRARLPALTRALLPALPPALLPVLICALTRAPCSPRSSAICARIRADICMPRRLGVVDVGTLGAVELDPACRGRVRQADRQHMLVVAVDARTPAKVPPLVLVELSPPPSTAFSSTAFSSTAFSPRGHARQRTILLSPRFVRM